MSFEATLKAFIAEIVKEVHGGVAAVEAAAKPRGRSPATPAPTAAAAAVSTAVAPAATVPAAGVSTATPATVTIKQVADQVVAWSGGARAKVVELLGYLGAAKLSDVKPADFHKALDYMKNGAPAVSDASADLLS